MKRLMAAALTVAVIWAACGQNPTALGEYETEPADAAHVIELA